MGAQSAAMAEAGRVSGAGVLLRQARMHGDVGFGHRDCFGLQNDDGQGEVETGDREAVAAMERFEDRLARGLAQVINILDPDVIVIGGGVSKVKHIYQALPKKLAVYVFGGEMSTPVMAAMYGDSSGVRGAAWLWPSQRA